MIVIIKLLKYREEWGDNTHKECNVFTTIFICCITVILLLLCVIWGLKTHLCVLESCSVISNSLWPHGILQARILKWVAFPFSRGSSQPRYQTQVSHIAGRFFTSWVTREALSVLESWYLCYARKDIMALEREIKLPSCDCFKCLFYIGA